MERGIFGDCGQESKEGDNLVSPGDISSLREEFYWPGREEFVRGCRISLLQ